MTDEHKANILAGRRNYTMTDKHKANLIAGLKKTKIYTREIIGLMRKLAKEGKTLKEARGLISVEIGRDLVLSSFRTKSGLHKISYIQPHLNFEKFKILKDTKLKKLIDSLDKMTLYEIRDKIIEEFEIDIEIKYLRSFCSRNQIEVIELDKSKRKRSRRNLRNET